MTPLNAAIAHADGAEHLLIGESPVMRGLRAVVRKLGPTTLPVLIQGPTGAGKELVARALHLESTRRGDFVPFNVCAIADTMFEDAMFGHVRGAFTGAHADRTGYLSEAHDGSLFLDEISGLTLASQAKLLRVLETGQYRPVGARVDRRSSFRTIAATNEDLNVSAAERRFRSDLLHRLSGAVVQVPPLDDRREDIPMLAQHFLAMSDDARRSGVRFSADALRALQDRAWPGNVRELRHAVERITILAEQTTVSAAEVRRILGRHAPAVADARAEERRQLVAALESCEGKVQEVAALLGLHQATVYRRMKEHGVPTRRWRLGVQNRPPRDGGWYGADL